MPCCSSCFRTRQLRRLPRRRRRPRGARLRRPLSYGRQLNDVPRQLDRVPAVYRQLHDRYRRLHLLTRTTKLN